MNPTTQLQKCIEKTFLISLILWQSFSVSSSTLYTWLILLDSLALTLSNAGIAWQFCKFHSVNFTALTRLQYWDVVRRCNRPPSPPKPPTPLALVQSNGNSCVAGKDVGCSSRRLLLVSADFMQISTVNLCRATRIHCCRSAESWLSVE